MAETKTDKTHKRLFLLVFFAISLVACRERAQSALLDELGSPGGAVSDVVGAADALSSDGTSIDVSTDGDATVVDIAGDGPADVLDVGEPQDAAAAVPVEVVEVDVEPGGSDALGDSVGVDVLQEPDIAEDEDGAGIEINIDAGPGPILGPPDVAENVDAGPAAEDTSLPLPDVVDTEPDVADEPDVPDEPDVVAVPDVDEPPPAPTSCDPNPCFQAAPHTCSGDLAESRFVPGSCLMVAGVPACSYADQAMNCVEAGGSCVDGLCADAPPSPSVGELVVVEIMRNPVPGARQWLEFFVTAESERNLAGCGIADGAGNVHVFSPAPLIVGPESFVLIAEAEPTSDGVPAPDVTMPVGSLDLLSDAGPLYVSCMGTLVDIVDYTSQTVLYPFPATQGVSMQVGPGNYSAESNDDSKMWCDAPDPYTFGSYGSPGEANPSCNADIDRCRLWYPAFGAGFVGQPLEATAVVFDEGITDLTINGPDLTNELAGQLGLGPDGTNPEVAPQDFMWMDAVPTFFPPSSVPPTEDMYGAWLVPEAPGTYDLAARFTPDGGVSWLYCDLDGSNNGYQLEEAGHVVVSP